MSPFKSQNMALNSFITSEGKEMGRAQVVQAEAAGVEPSVEMNPILIKPTTDSKAQVIINGEVYGNMSAIEYHEFKPQLSSMIKNIYKNLSNKNDIIVIEGAGSPAEINLREQDIVNMGMAEIADAPVILVGDIDKGGVFAALAGTMLLLSDEEKNRVKGVIINKFRGDIEILKPGLKMLEDIIHVPVLGVLPYTKIDIEDEDSLSEKFVIDRKVQSDELYIAVIRIPYLSNFTDFNAIENIKGVELRYVEHPENLGNPDLILIPGSKNTIMDLLFIRKTGLEKAIINLHEQSVPIIGICGGYQMLGMEIEDPCKTESDLLKIDGMGLLNIKTVFKDKKVTTQVEAVINDDIGFLDKLKGTEINGYEIHMGDTEHFSGCVPFMEIKKSINGRERTIGGVRNLKGSVYGTYMHGIFDNMDFTNGIINNLKQKKGVKQDNHGIKGFKEFKEEQYDKLAMLLRENIDMEEIYKILEI